VPRFAHSHTPRGRRAQDADGSVYANRAAGGGSVQLSQPAWLAPLNTDADADGNGEADGAAFLLFVKDDAGDTLYLKEFATGTWPATDQTFGGTADMFVLGEGVTSLTACVAIPVLACDPNCPDEYTESSQKAHKPHDTRPTRQALPAPAPGARPALPAPAPLPPCSLPSAARARAVPKVLLRHRRRRRHREPPDPVRGLHGRPRLHGGRGRVQAVGGAL
jgi:hypothetical protein